MKSHFGSLLVMVFTTGMALASDATYTSATAVTSSSADALTPGQDGYCKRRFKDFQQLAAAPESRIAFENQGGLIDGGVCWWHSRLQRNAIYMARYNPELPKPSQKQASRILSDLINEKGPVVIPGYSNFYEFTRDHTELVQSKLNGWQKKDGFLKFAWIRGLRGDMHRDPTNFKKEMDRLYGKVGVVKQIAYAKLQLEGVVAHAWLIIGMTKTPNGYNLYYIDSNEPLKTGVHEYRYGDTQVEVVGFGRGGLYEGYPGTLEKLRSNFKKACGRDML